MIGDNEDEFITGSSGNDTIEGGGGADHLDGGAVNDFIFGGDGNDFINGGAGNDTMSGNAGDNIFSFDETETNDVDSVFDFDIAADALDFSNHTQVQSRSDLSFVQFGNSLNLSFGGDNIEIFGIGPNIDTAELQILF